MYLLRGVFMDMFDLDDICDEISLLELKKDRLKMIKNYLVRVKPVRWKDRYLSVLKEEEIVMEALFIAYTKIV